MDYNITDIFKEDEYSDFLDYCKKSGKTLASEVTNFDFVAFRTIYRKSREYIEDIKIQLEQSLLEHKRSGNDIVNNCIKEDFSQDQEETDNSIKLGNITENTSEDYTFIGKDKKNCYEENTTEDIYKKGEAWPSICESFLKIDFGKDITGNKNDILNYDRNMMPVSLSNIQQEFSDIPLMTLFNVESNFGNDKVTKLNLSVRSLNCLKGAGCSSVEDVLNLSVDDMREIPALGEKSIKEIIQKAHDYTKEDFNTERIIVQDDINANISLKDNPYLKNIITSVITDNNYDFESIPLTKYKELKPYIDAIQISGWEICNQAYLNPQKGLDIYHTLKTFIAPYETYWNYTELINEKINQLPEDLKKKKLKPFIQAYELIGGDQKVRMFQYCDGNILISQTMSLYRRCINVQDEKTVFKQVNKFIEWLSFDIDKIINSVSNNIYNIINNRPSRDQEIFALRMKGETLEKVGSLFGITRERVRQIDKRLFQKVWNVLHEQYHDLFMLVYAIRNGDMVLSENELKDELGDFAMFLWDLIKHDPEQRTYYYSKNLDAVVIKIDEGENLNEEALLSAIDDLKEDSPDVIAADEKDALLLELSNKVSMPVEVLYEVFPEIYHLTGKFYSKNRITVASMCGYVLKNYYPVGYKTSDKFEGDRFKQFLIEFFGDRALSISNRAIDIKVGTIGVLCDRGKYIHPDLLQVNQEIIDKINDYIEKSSRTVLPYGEIFEALKSIFKGTQITNKYILQGALKKYGCKFKTGRNCVRKIDSVTLVDELDAFVEERGISHKDEILAEFTSLSDVRLGQVVARSSNVYSIDNGFYIHVSQFDIQPNDYNGLREYLSKACCEVPINIHVIYDEVIERFPDFMCRNEFHNTGELFAALEYMFSNEFVFSRPYIAKRGSEGVSGKSVVRQLIQNIDSIEIEDLFDICEDHGIKCSSLSYLCNMLAPDYVRINKTTFMRYDLLGISNEIMEQIVSIINDMLKQKTYIVVSKITDFIWFPELNVEWNGFLLESILSMGGELNVIHLNGDPLNAPISVIVTEKDKNETFNSFLVKILTPKVLKKEFTSKTEMEDWLKREGLINKKLPGFLEGTKYFYVNKNGIQCADNQNN